MNTEQLTALRRLLDYVRGDESRNFDESEGEARTTHIYNDIRTLDEFANPEPDDSGYYIDFPEQRVAFVHDYGSDEELEAEKRRQGA